MNKTKKFLAIIPARGGSKRLPRKNVLPLAGKPLIAWTIEAALQCKEINKIVISSDDDEILSVAAAYPVDCLQRPGDLASDTASSFDVIKHVIHHYPDYEYCVLLQPTSPLRTGEHIQEAIRQLKVKHADAVISVCECEHSPLWSNTLPENMSMRGFIREGVINQRSQDLPVHYRLNGAIYILNTRKLLEADSFIFKNNVYAYEMSRRSSVDIDDVSDFNWAQYCLTSEFE